MSLKSLLLTVYMLFNYFIFFGQTGFPYDAEWKLIDSLMNKKNLPKSALTEVNKVYAASKKENQEAQWIKATIYRNHLKEMDDRNINQQVTELENEMAIAPPRVTAILKSMEAEFLFQYLQGHRYEMHNRTTIADDTTTDITTWTISQMNEKIVALYLSSLDIPVEIKQTPIDNFDPVLIKGNTREWRPVLFDLLAYRALDYFRIGDRGQVLPENDSLLYNPVLFSDAPFFSVFNFSGNKPSSNYSIAIAIYQQLLRLHAKDFHLDAWIDADISRIQYVYQNTKIEERDSLYLKALSRITGRFPTLSVVSQAWYLQALWWSNQAGKYNPLSDSLHRFDNLKSIALCSEAIGHSDSSEGKSNCEWLLRSIKRKSYSINIEQVNIPDKPFRALITYKNVNHLYGRIIKMNDSSMDKFAQNADDTKYWSKLIHLPAVKIFRQTIPDTKDFQQHRLEIKIDPLPAGQYALLTSSDSVFSESAVVSLTSFYSSSIAFLKNGTGYFVLDRDSGHPLKGVKVKSYQQDYRSGKRNYTLLKTYFTDLNGYFHAEEKNYTTQKLDFFYGRDYLSSNQYITYYRNSEDDQEDNSDNKKDFEEDKLKDNLFTDRSIYRPGQTVYFKGLLVTKDFNTKRYKVVKSLKIQVYLVDVNDQKLDSLLLNSNDFGSIQGSFQLPKNVLGGVFKIRDGTTSDEQYFSVEEYKRPSFYIKYDTVEGAFKVGDSIGLSGNAIAYAGNALDRAKYNFRIFRETRFPYPWLFHRYPANSETEITHGESVTNQDGKFNIRFIALSDKSIQRQTKPVYTYRVEITVTDNNGESRSATTSVSGSEQSFEIVSSFPDLGRIPRDSLFRIPVSTKNASGLFLKEKLTLVVFPLEGPDRLIRSRFWAQPDQFVMTQSDYVAFFPNDEYKDETNIKSWQLRPKSFEITDSTHINGFFGLDRKMLESVKPGWYLLEFKGRDQNGEEIIDKKYIEVIGEDGKSGVLTYNMVPDEVVSGEPGKSVKIYTGSYAKNLSVIRIKQTASDSVMKYSFYKLNQEIKSTSYMIQDSDRGGFAFYDVFIKNSRWYTSEHRFSVPWTNKELQISYETWKDKTLPGNKEQWKIKISGNKKDQVTAEVLTSMYDASLDQFKMHSWSVPDIYPVYNKGNPWNAANNFNAVYSNIRPSDKPDFSRVKSNEYDALINFGYGRGVGLKLQGVASGIAIKERNLVGDVVVAGYGVAKKKEPIINQNEEENEVEKLPPNSDDNIQIRKNFNETAFFLPDLKTDAEGNVDINFTMPDALTKWKWMVLANTKDLSFGYSEKMIVTQKELMIQTNMPRFFREGDTMIIPIKIANISSQNMTGTVQLEWLNVMNNQNVDSAVGNIKSTQSFLVNATQSGTFFFRVAIPANFIQPLLYRVTAKTNMLGALYSDGEENIIPVLSNRMLVTESLPLNMDGKEEREFKFEKLLKSANSNTLQSQALTIEYTTNPAWYAVQALPYLIEFPYECSEQIFNRLYANALAAHIVQVSPAMKAIFEKWKNTDTTALMSNLQKNDELKSVLLRETPWVLQAQSETQQKRNLALLFDMIKMQDALNSAVTKLQQMQSEDGGFAWFKGGPEDRYITQYIISGIGRLKKLKAIPDNLRAPLDRMVKSALSYLDSAISLDFAKRDKSNSKWIDPSQIQYLYMRSYYPEFPVPVKFGHVVDYYRKMVTENWMKQSVYMQGMIALYLNRTGNIKSSEGILASLKENATHNSELGMYWKSVQSGYYWQEAPIETQSLLIETFQELNAGKKIIDEMKYWLLQQKRTQHWPTTKATADACYALLLNGSDWLSSQQNVGIQLGNYKISSIEEKTEAGTGYLKKLIPGEKVLPEMGNIHVTVSNPSSTANPSWGAVYWQYFENLDKITVTQTPLSVKKNLFIEKNSDKGKVLEEVSILNVLKPGDKLIMRIIIKTDRGLEYVHLKDMRAACLEPANVLSGYQWQNGLGYYQSTQDASTSFFFDRLTKGTYIFEYPVFVTTAGSYNNGISSLESMYAPEFSAHSEGIRIQVKPN